MNRIRALLHFRFSESLLARLLTVWLLLFPFDAYILPIDLGLLTVYPYLLLTGFLLLYTLLAAPETRLLLLHRYAMVAYALLAVYAAVYAFFVPFSAPVLYDVRSMLLQAATVVVLVRAFYLLGEASFRAILVKSLSVVLIFLLLAAWLEYFTGIHLAGAHTEKLLHYPVGNHTYAPVFVYDNPNTFLVYLLGVAVLLFFLEPTWLARFEVAFPILVQLLFFALIADSRLAKLMTLALMFWMLFRSCHARWASIRGFYVPALAGMVLAGLAVLAMNPLYYGPIWKNGSDYQLNAIEVPVERNGKLVFDGPDSLIARYGKDSLLEAYTGYERHGNMGSDVVRANLLRNGMQLIRNFPLTGIGPGQYIRFANSGLLHHPTGSVNSPHESITELLSQYGIPVGLLIVLAFIWAGFTHLRSRQSLISKLQFQLLAFVCLGIGAMPSAWFILNIGWMMSGVLLISSTLSTMRHEQQ